VPEFESFDQAFLGAEAFALRALFLAKVGAIDPNRP
jgi:hypothetical protein